MWAGNSYLIFNISTLPLGIHRLVLARQLVEEGEGRADRGCPCCNWEGFVFCRFLFEMLIIIVFIINLVFVGVDWWWLLTDLRRRSRLLLQSGSHHGCCLYWRCNRHLRGPRRLPKNQIASTWRSRLNQSYVRKRDFADSAPTEYCTIFHFPSTCLSTGVTFYIFPMYKSIYATWIIRGPMDFYMI